MIKLPGIIATLFITALVAWMGCDLLYRGAAGLHARLFVLKLHGTLGAPAESRRCWPAPASLSAWRPFLAALVSLPLAVAYTGLEALAGLREEWFARPSISASACRASSGALWQVHSFGGYCGFGFSLLSGVLTLACLLAPIMTTGFITGLEMVENDIREAMRRTRCRPLARRRGVRWCRRGASRSHSSSGAGGRARLLAMQRRSSLPRRCGHANAALALRSRRHALASSSSISCGTVPGGQKRRLFSRRRLIYHHARDSISHHDADAGGALRPVITLSYQNFRLSVGKTMILDGIDLELLGPGVVALAAVLRVSAKARCSTPPNA